MSPTIYRIEFPDGKFYIGATVNFVERRRTHLRHATKAKSVNNHLQQAFNEHGVCGIYEIASGFSREQLHLLERQIIEQDDPPLNQNKTPSRLPDKYNGANKPWGPYRCIRDAAEALGMGYIATKKLAWRESFEQYMARKNKIKPQKMGPPDPRKNATLLNFSGGWHRRADVCKVSAETARDRRKRGWGYLESLITPAQPTASPVITLCKKYGVSPNNFYARRHNGWTVHEALGLRDRPKPKGSKVKKLLITVAGETRTLAGWAQKLNVSPGTLRGRRALGWSDEQMVGYAPPPSTQKAEKKQAAALQQKQEKEQAKQKALLDSGVPPWQAGAPFTVGGVDANLKDHCDRLGVTVQLVRGRLQAGWPIWAAFDPPQRATTGTRFRKSTPVEKPTRSAAC